MASKKGQASTEYLIILLVVMIIVLASMGVMRWFPALGVDISAEESRRYWRNTVPLSITDWRVTPELDEAAFVIENRSTDVLVVDEILVPDYPVGIWQDITIMPGEKGTVTGLAGTSAPFEEQYKFDIEIIYYEYGKPLEKKTFVGEKPISGVSIGRISQCACGDWANVSCGAGGCNTSRIQQIRTCIPGDCDAASQCVCQEICCDTHCAGQGKNGQCLGDLGCSCWG